MDAFVARGSRYWLKQMDRGVRITRGSTVVYVGRAKIGERTGQPLPTDPKDATATATLQTIITIPLSADGLVKLGDRCETGSLTPKYTGSFTPDGRVVYVGQVSFGLSGQTAVRITGTQQAAATPSTQIVLWRRNSGTWVELDPQPFQLTLANREPEQDRSDPTRSMMYAGTLIGADDVDIRPGDRFEWEGFWSFVGDVDRSGGQTEAAFEQNRAA